MIHPKRLLITGGAGYIGSHMLLAAKDKGYDLTVVDNLSTGHESNLVAGKFILGDLQDNRFVQDLFAKHSFDAVVHFAGLASVPESIQYPERYYLNNTCATFNLVQACLQHKVKHFLFSSSAAVYGHHPSGFVNESSPTHPMNPYGQSKLMAEQIIQDCAKAHGMSTAILRYFNVAGVDAACRVGPFSHKVTPLMKAVVETALRQRPFLEVYGEDYPTPDGTGVRDFIHINDLISAHLLALNYLFNENQSILLNCGYGCGFSVKQVVEATRLALQTPVPIQVAPARQGDCAQMVADPTLLKERLGWRPQFNQLELMIESTYRWEMAQCQSSHKEEAALI